MAQSQYATIQELTSLAITQQAASRFGSGAMTAALQAASSEADAYISSQFVLPLEVNPPGWKMDLTLAVCNIAAYRLYSQFGFNPAAPADELIRRRYESAIEYLKKVANQEIHPQWVDSSGSTSESVAEGPYIESDPAVGFTQRGVDTSISDPNWSWWGW